MATRIVRGQKVNQRKVRHILPALSFRHGAMGDIEHVMFQPPANQRVFDRIDDRPRLQVAILQRLARQDRGDGERRNAERHMPNVEIVPRSPHLPLEPRRVRQNCETAGHQNLLLPGLFGFSAE